ncbi:ATP-binding cassette domain-containing protein [Natrinema sp. 1APR25-10V2]|uniref:ABC transporter ATP-binding protein n=1 Tax=Natrinema sp. 1APR25-10V2 TaxID=2951081 RepID=UPI00287603FD|nr:ATP-binding cassette domain-containing protein [Natrinema sp. 1APR25-10V2]MDS0477025.1 ATP-binding cassette domain-containing protein [Natrinema sp. 1APR25-10V2]
MLLELEGLDASIEGITVLREIDLAVDETEVVGIIGRNGAGKTSTFKSVMGLQHVQRGSVSFRGEDITVYPTHERKRLGIGFAPEDRRLISKLTARENIEMALWGSDDDGIDIDDRLEVVLDIFPAMERFLDQPAGKLSGGQQQMVTVSRALVAEPELVLLDEPFEGLAPSIKQDLTESISVIRDELGIAVFVAESQINQVKDFVDRLYVIERGEIIAETDVAGEITDDEELMQIIGGG